MWLDMLPNNEKKRLRKRMRSPEAYQESREKVKSLEEITDEVDQNELMADLQFALETEPRVQEALKQEIEKDLTDVGIENMVEGAPSSSMIDALSSGSYQLSVRSNESTGSEEMVVTAEGHVSETLPMKKSYSDKYIAT